MRSGSFLIVALVTGVICAGGAAESARAQSADVSGLQDVNFGTISAPVDQSSRQDVVVCSYRNNPHNTNYSVIASGSGSGSAFVLSSGAATLAYDVQWADSPGQTSGTMLQPGVAATGFGNAATGFECPQQPVTASLIITIRAAALTSAQAGSYSGSLQITIVPQ